MSKHTNGPWKIVEGGSLHLGIVSPDDDKTIADVWFIRRNPDEGAANARLISAAPDLLEALKSMLFCADDGPSFDAAVSQACAAIFKATGEQP